MKVLNPSPLPHQIRKWLVLKHTFGLGPDGGLGSVDFFGGTGSLCLFGGTGSLCLFGGAGSLCFFLGCRLYVPFWCFKVICNTHLVLFSQSCKYKCNREIHRVIVKQETKQKRNETKPKTKKIINK